MPDSIPPSDGQYDPGLPTHDAAALARLRALIGDGAVQGLLDQLAQELPRRRVSVGDAWARGDRAAAGREAHALSSPAGLLGFIALRAACQSLQSPAQAQASAPASGQPAASAQPPGRPADRPSDQAPVQAPGPAASGRAAPDPAFDACCRAFDAACAAASAELGAVRSSF